MTARLTFSRSHRLTEPAEFARTRADGKVVRGEHMNIVILRPPEGGRWRAAFITSKRIGNAVVRNRVRRLLREIVRLHQAEFSGSPWIVTIARKSAAGATLRELETEWLRLARRAGVCVA